MIEFIPETHTYLLDGKPLISVTQLMKKHGLSPDYSGVSDEVLQKAAERGTVVHKEIEEYIKTGEVGFTPDCASFVQYMNEQKAGAMTSEQIVYNDLVAGTVDLSYYNAKLDKDIIADAKKTANLNLEPVSWQLSIYDYLSGKMIGKNAYIYEMAQVFHFNKDGELKVVEVKRKPYEEVERLMECERKGEVYTKNAVVPAEQLNKLQAVFAEIQSLEEAQKEQKEQLETLKEALLAEMEKNAIDHIDTDTLKITYVAPYSRTAIDTTRLKKEQPEMAKLYEKKTEIAASLKITPKGDKK